VISKIISISKTLLDHFNDINKSVYTIFLCGGASKEEALMRFELKDAIKNTKSSDHYNVYMPEDIFLELLMGYKKYDSLSLENILAKSVNSIVIPLQSPGTFTELGAFSNKDELKNKLIVINNPKYKSKKSFINTGPIMYLQQNTKSVVLNRIYDRSHLKSLAKEIRMNTRQIAESNLVEYSLKNPLSSFNFYLALVFVLGPIKKANIEEIIKELDSSLEATIVNETVINSLINQRKIIMNNEEEYSLTKKAFYEISNLYTTKKASYEVLDFLSDLRLDAISVTLRRKTRKIWGRSST